jgi:hypothetical protein
MEPVVEPRVDDRMRRLPGEPGPQGTELGRTLQRREELRVGAREVVRGGEFSGDRLV